MWAMVRERKHLANQLQSMIMGCKYQRNEVSGKTRNLIIAIITADDDDDGKGVRVSA